MSVHFVRYICGAIAAIMMGSVIGLTPVQAQETFSVGQSGTFYLAANSQSRVDATADADFAGGFERGTVVQGEIVLGNDGRSHWLKPLNNEGFLNANDLSASRRQMITLGPYGQQHALTNDCAFQDEPQDGAPIKVTLGAGQSVIAIGIVAGGFTEFKMPRGGVGYRQSLTSCQRHMGPLGPANMNILTLTRLPIRAFEEYLSGPHLVKSDGSRFYSYSSPSNAFIFATPSYSGNVGYINFRINNVPEKIEAGSLGEGDSYFTSSRRYTLTVLNYRMIPDRDNLDNESASVPEFTLEIRDVSSNAWGRATVRLILREPEAG